MKRIFIIIVAMLAIATLPMRAEINPAQTKILTEIHQFLLSEGYKPVLDLEDGCVTFTKSKINYKVLLDDRDTSPYYIELTLSYNYGERITKERVIANFEHVNIKKAVKLVVFDKTYSFRVQMYVVNSKNFIDTFEKNMAQIASADQALTDAILK